MPRAPSKPWFAPKRYGYGAGLPIAWQGWALLAGYLIVIGAALLLPAVLPDSGVFVAVYGAIVLLATAVLLVVCERKTEGGWRWRWGEDD